MNRRVWWIGGAVAIASLMLMAVLFILVAVTLGLSMPSWGGRVGLIRIRGVITDPEPFIKELKRFAQDRRIRALVVRIESGGGVVSASQEMFEELRDFRDGGYGRPTPVIASFGSVAASGAYYVACAADRIVASPGSITGSIGVIMETPEAASLLDRIGLRFNTVTSGEFKDTGNFSREMTPRERALLQDSVDDVYSQFLNVVVEARGLSVAESLAAGATLESSDTASSPSVAGEGAIAAHIRQYADGRILTGQQALNAGLIDELGTIEDALAMARELANLSDDAEVVEYRPQPSLIDVLTGSTEGALRLLQNRSTAPIQYRGDW